MKKTIAIIILILCITFIFSLTGCNKQESLYEYGIEVTTLIGKMVKDEAFLEYTGITTMAKPKPDLTPINMFAANDYDTPIRAYKVTTPQLEAYRNYYLKDKNEIFDKLSDEMKDSINKRYNLAFKDGSFIFQIVNNKYFTGEITWEDNIIANDMFAVKEFKIKLKEPVNYIYVFETGKPIIVNFTPKDKKTIIATGMFFFGDCTSLSSIREDLEPFGCTVENL